MTIKEKMVNIKKQTIKYWNEHEEAICVAIGACIGGLIIGAIHGKQLEDTYDKAYSEGYSSGYGEWLDNLYLDAAFNGGKNSATFRNDDGYRLGLTYETLPNKR